MTYSFMVKSFSCDLWSISVLPSKYQHILQGTLAISGWEGSLKHPRLNDVHRVQNGSMVAQAVQHLGKVGADQAPLGSPLHLLRFIPKYPLGARQLVCVSSGTVRILSIQVCTQRKLLDASCRERRFLQGSTRCSLPTSSFLKDQLLLIKKERTFCQNTGRSGRFLKHGSHSAICPCN